MRCTPIPAGTPGARAIPVLDTLVRYVHPDNTSSIALAHRLGATPGAHIPHQVPGALAFRHEVAA